MNKGRQVVRTRLAFKLFGAFFMILVMVVGAMAVSRYFFTLNFHHYIIQTETERLQAIVPSLREAYRRHGNWDRVAANPSLWQRLIHADHNFPNRHPGPYPPGPQNPARSGMQPPETPPAPGNTPPPVSNPGPYLNPGQNPRPNPNPNPGPNPGQNPTPGPQGPLSAFLVDADDKPIVGMPGPDADHHLVPIEVGDKVVGWLGLNHHKPMDSGPPAILIRRQSQIYYLVGSVVVGLTALIAFLFSRHLLSPIRQLTQVTRELSNRDFTVRITSKRQDELGQLAENFNAMAGTLQTYETMRRQWVSDISHELRTPLAVLRGEIEAIEDGIREASPENLSSLRTEIIRLSRLVEDLHLLSTADSDHFWLDRVPMQPHAVLQEVAATFRQRFDRRRIDIDLAVNDGAKARIRGDRHRLTQVFTNIFDNVLKYVPPHGLLSISGHADKKRLTLRFDDSGPGVPDDALARLFDRLYRVDVSRSRETGGSGLGLAICRQIIENHDGRIWAEHSPMGGLSICIQLPVIRQ